MLKTIYEHAEFEEVAYTEDKRPEVEAIDQAAVAEPEETEANAEDPTEEKAE